jgi:hypothetical protein
VDILSTVSGGSIIGAAYVMGVPPREFALRLSRQKPGLSDELLSLAISSRGTLRYSKSICRTGSSAGGSFRNCRILRCFY